MKKTRIGVLTGGGDVPGLNGVIRDITYSAEEKGMEVVGIKRGWGGLIFMDPDEPLDKLGENIEEAMHVVKLTRANTRRIYRTGGTILHTSRVNPKKVKSKPGIGPDLLQYRDMWIEETEPALDMTPDVMKNIEKLGLDYLIAIGGDDTLSYAPVVEKSGLPVIGIPKTMDGDVNGTEYTIGLSSAISKANDAINSLITTIGSHERFGIIECFGRSAGFTALYSAYASRVDRVVIPECEFDFDRLTEVLEEDKQNKWTNYSIVLISEGAKPVGGEESLISKETDLYGNPKLGGIGQTFADHIEKVKCRKTMPTKLDYLLRGGAPDSYDQLMSSTFANIAVKKIAEKASGIMVAMVDGTLTTVDINLVTAAKRIVDVDKFYNVDRYRPKYENFDGRPGFFL